MNARTAAPDAAGSPERFGFSWAIYDSLLPAHETQFRRWTAPLTPVDWRGLSFLDAGCGMGRNSYFALRYGARRGRAIDLDPRSLAGAQTVLREFPNVEVVRDSIHDIAPSASFDIVFSIGVVHHLASPEAAVRRLAGAARPGGRVLLWLYGRENNGWIVGLFDPLRRLVFSRLPLPLVHAVSLPLAALLWAGLRVGGARTGYGRMIAGFGFRHLRAIVFDHMIPRLARYYTRADAVALLAQAGLIEIEASWTNEMSWTVIGRKPE